MQSLKSALTHSRPKRYLQYTSFLIPAPGAAPEGLAQMRLPVLDHDRFFQHQVEPAVSYRGDPTPTPRASRPFAVLEPMDPEAAAGVPPALRLRLFDAGAQLHPWSITLHETRYEPAIFALMQAGIPGELVDPIPADAYADGSVWRFFATFDSPAT
jgi:hypothetical protein